ncbi:MAG: hypothetical protein ACRD21_05410, partial [Vicinamibacteria bacterium]
MRKAPILGLAVALHFAPQALAQVGTPVLNQPTGVISNTRPTYAWNSVTGATDYYLWINKGTGMFFTRWYNAASICAGNGCSIRPNLILTEGPYTWWVQAKKGSQVGLWTQARNFRVSVAGEPPGAAVLVSPVGNSSTSTPTFRWTGIATASEYYLWVNSSTGNVLRHWYPAASLCSGTNCSIGPSSALAAGNYTWWIQARNGAGDGAWSAPLHFHVGASGGPPPAPVLTSPSGSIGDRTPTYRW